jgi:hypothetical protein
MNAAGRRLSNPFEANLWANTPDAWLAEGMKKGRGMIPAPMASNWSWCYAGTGSFACAFFGAAGALAGAGLAGISLDSRSA